MSTKHREGFQEMVQDALASEIDLIVTKSVSRFARNMGAVIHNPKAEGARDGGLFP